MFTRSKSFTMQQNNIVYSLRFNMLIFCSSSESDLNFAAFATSADLSKNHSGILTLLFNYFLRLSISLHNYYYFYYNGLKSG